MYKTKHFALTELVHPQVLKAIGANNSWMRLDRLVLEDIDFIREEWGDSIYINLGVNDSRGLRPPNDPDGAFYSVHKQGKAFDLIPKNGDTKGLWNLVKKLIEDEKLKSINTLEDLSFTPTWVHVANMNIEGNLYIVKP